MLKRTPYHPLLLAAFPVLQLAAHNIEQIDPGQALRPLLIALAAAALVREAVDASLLTLSAAERQWADLEQTRGEIVLLQRQIDDLTARDDARSLGADGLQGDRTGLDRDGFTHRAEFQADFYRRQFAVMSRFPSVVGTAPWVLYDFRSPLRQNKYQRGYNRKGLVADDHRTRKLAFDIVRDLYEGLSGAPQ